MAFYKCKMCGGDLEIVKGVSIAECEYCGTKQTVPSAIDENLENFFNRANTMRIKGEFDKAAELYEKIIQADSAQSEAYWGLILCKYGIEYVDDPSSFRKIPTCHRASYDSIIADDDYKSALEHADISQRLLYEEQAKEIDRIQKDILAVAQKEEPYDVFICYKETDSDGIRTEDSVIANDIYYQLTNEGFKVFYAAITLEGKLGSAYEPIIFAALNSAKVMLAIGTKPAYFNAVWVKNEWSRFLKIIKNDRSKLLIPCYRDMDAYDLPDEFAHLQAQNMAKIGFINDLVRGIKKVVKKDEPKVTTVVKEKVVTVAAGGASAGASMSATTASLLKRTFIFLGDGNWNSANSYCEKVLDIEPENALCYVAKLMIELKVKQQENLKNYPKPFDDSNNYKNAYRFADENLQNELTGYIEHINARLQREAEELAASQALLVELKKLYRNERDFEETRQSMVYKIEGLTNSINSLSALEDEWDDLVDEYNPLIVLIDENDEEIQKLADEKSKLKWFADRKKRSELSQEIKALEIKGNNLRAERNMLSKKMMGYDEPDELLDAIERRTNERAEAQKHLDQLMERSIDTVRRELSQYSIGAKLLKQYDDFRNSFITGGSVVLGAYELDNNQNNGYEKIEWLVLKVEDNGMALVVSKNALDCRRYNAQKAAVSWHTCSLRKWLNNDFFNIVFRPNEQNKICTSVTIIKESHPRRDDPHAAPDKFEDKVFLLSELEAKKRFASSNARVCTPSAYAKARGASTDSANGGCAWWLRTLHHQNYGACVLNSGTIISKKDCHYVDDKKHTVRPALWIDIHA